MSNIKRKLDDAFLPSELENIVENTYCVEHTIYKILRKSNQHDNSFLVLTDRGKRYDYHADCIRYTSMSANEYRAVVEVTKTEMIEIFAAIPFSDVWTAKFYKKNHDPDWAMNFVKKINKMDVDKAAALVKSSIDTINKTDRIMTGKKNNMTPKNNMYSVRDVILYFDELSKTNDIKNAEKCSFRNLDVNTITELIYNNIKYVKK